MTGAGRLVRGELSPVGHPDTHGVGVEYCDSAVLRRLRRASLAKLRAEVEPVEPAALGRFLPSWHGFGGRVRAAPTADDVLSVVEQLAGAPLPASAVESLILPGAAARLLPRAAGRADDRGRGHLGGVRRAVRRRRLDRPRPDRRRRPAAAGSRRGHPDRARCTTRIVSTLEGGALFFRQLVDRATVLVDKAPNDAEVVAALWDLVWAGLVTGDTLGPLRAQVAGHGAHKPRRQAPRGRYARLRAGRPQMPSRSGPPTVAGRWALTPAPRDRRDPARPRADGGVPGAPRRPDPRRARHRTRHRRVLAGSTRCCAAWRTPAR